MSFKVNGKIGSYLLLEQIGQGGMGTVFKAYHPELDRFVALKVLHPAHQEDPTFIARFQREARLVAKLEHPNIVPIYDFARDENLPYLVMKFIEGTTLKNRLAQSPLGFNEIMQMVNSVGSALAYAHQQAILHRDIKPSNILIGKDGVMYLADFGLARIVQAEASTLSVDSIMGTPHYISPEQATGRDDLTERTDVYSFGVMLYETVVGQIPFNAKTPFSIIHDHIYTPLPLPRSLNPNVTEPVEHVLLKALAKDPSERYDNIARMVAEFNNAWLNVHYSAPNNLQTIPESQHAVNQIPAQQPIQKNAVVEPSKMVATSAPEKKRPASWIYFGAAVVLLISLAFSLIPGLGSKIVSNFVSTNTLTIPAGTSTTVPVVLIASTSTSQIMNTETTSVAQLINTSAPEQSNTQASQPTNTQRQQPTNTQQPQPTNTARPQPTNTPVPPPTNTPSLPEVILTEVNVPTLPPLLP